MEKPLTMDELEAAMKPLPAGKCPGRNGFPKEFYSWGWDFIQPVTTRKAARDNFQHTHTIMNTGLGLLEISGSLGAACNNQTSCVVS